MITWILAGLIIGAAVYIIYKKVKKIKSGDFSCEGCKGSGSCPGCSSQKPPAQGEEEEEEKEEEK